jgi:hypothetical protein
MQKTPIGLLLATSVRVEPLLPFPAMAIRFLHTPPPRSASNWPFKISWAAALNWASVKIFLAHREKVFNLKKRLFFMTHNIALYAIVCNR